MPLISVIVPVYNVENFLKRCIDSIINQTFQDYELILVDDGSPDNSGQQCDEFAKNDSRIKVIHKANGGLSSARNSGIKVAVGRYLCFVDSDDWLQPSMLENLFSLIETNHADIVEGSFFTANKFKIVNDKTDNYKKSILNKDEALLRFFRVTTKKIPYYAWGRLFRRETVAGIFFPEGLIFEDIYYNFFALIHSEKVIISEKPLYYYFQNAQGITHGHFSEKDLQLMTIWETIVDFCKKELPQYSAFAEINRERASLGLLCKCCRYGCDEKLENADIIKSQLWDTVKKSKHRLLKWNMPLNRKFLLCLIAINYHLVEWPFTVLRKVGTKK